MKYRVTEMGFIGRLVRPGEIIEWDGPPPIAGLVPVEDQPEPTAPVADEPRTVRPTRRTRATAAPQAADGSDNVDDVI
jgi:hypothetical protein